MSKRFTLSAALICLLLVFIGFQYGCRKKDNITTSPSASLTFSTTLVKFDTVFTTVGSATHNFTVKNPNKQAVKISHIMLQGGASSYFRINIDGRGTTDFPNYTLAAGDSIYIFAEVTVNPTAINTPFIVTDTILFLLNGKVQKVALQAFGRNAHFIKSQYIDCNAVWQNDGIPYVIYDIAEVKYGCTLTIQKGVNVYCHAKTLFAIKGTLITTGTKDEPVVFRQDRLEHTYDNEPGQWYGLRFLDSSSNNVMTHTIVSNGTVGIEVDSLTLNGSVKLTLSKCTIRHNSNSGLACFGATVNATNTLIFASGLFNVYCDLGGTYNFTHCTLENSNDAVSSRQPSIQLGNRAYKGPDSISRPFPLSAAFRNCIVYGNIDDEVKYTKVNSSSFTALFYRNIIKAKKMGFDNTNIINKDPNFKHPNAGDYHLDTLSPAIDHAVTYPPIMVTDDLDDIIRRTPTDTIPDLGAYEYKH
jgi:hypothetical protein